ncbi:hypothetical protein GCM10023196_089280 [Actinoallomurus vinaceus]|uniref:Lipoprotein n=1 Tax=Actinoallomurus vinaceus TaxID=1080074 RepID=A0ABP8USJ9_9ACTN
MGTWRIGAGLATGTAGLLLAGCGVGASDTDNELDRADLKDALPCTATVLDIKEVHVMDRSRSYDLRYRVSVKGRPAYEDTQQNTELSTIQVAQIVAVTKIYPCRVSRTDPHKVTVNWDAPVKAGRTEGTSADSPSPRPGRPRSGD